MTALPARSKAEQPAAGDSLGDRSVRYRFLVVDDHPFFRDGIIAWLERYPELECCGWADTVESALERVATVRPDIVLLDLQLRGSDGFDILATLRMQPNAPPVIVISHHDSPFVIDRAFRAGARAYIRKDEASTTVYNAIRTVLGGGIYHDTRPTIDRQGAASPPPIDPLRTLAEREMQVLRLLGRGYSAKQIAFELGISPKTADWYREQLKRKLRVGDGTTLVRYATLWLHDHRL